MATGVVLARGSSLAWAQFVPGEVTADAVAA